VVLAAGNPVHESSSARTKIEQDLHAEKLFYKKNGDDMTGKLLVFPQLSHFK
jgi:hypothetical protein